MRGQVIKIFSDFYYVDTNEGIVEAKLRSVLKKQNTDVYTGDFVELEQYDANSKQAFISSIIERKTVMSRPKVANITQVIIVSALKEPDLDFEQLDRYIAHCEYHKIKPVLCFNKEDITETEHLKKLICDIYEPLKYKIIFTSALLKTGIEELRPLLKNNSTILCGTSGAGKSSLINAILKHVNLKTAPVSDKTKRGTHTTRHCELISTDKNSFIVDTPGFSQLKFNIMPANEIQNLFTEFSVKTRKCKYKNCLHISEDGCSYSDIIMAMNISRYESYKKFISEAKEYEDKISKASIKEETRSKFNQNKIMTKISHKKRDLSRKTTKQRMHKEEY